jgi:AraC-like DNA-binding protein
LETQKPWLDSELNLNKLSELLQMPVHELSFLINSTLHKNFSELLHEYRIKEACRLLLDESYSDSKILSIAFDVGYTNKATFNAAFKNKMGVSPSAYKLMAKGHGMNEAINL